jgi:hypothetical protein
MTRRPPAGQPTDVPTPVHVAAPDPLKPRPVLFKVLGLVFGLWVVFLGALYFKTVYPRRSTAPNPDAQGSLRPRTMPAAAPGAKSS